MSSRPTPFTQISVVVSKALWARALPDGSVHGIGTGPQAVKDINLVVQAGGGQVHDGFRGRAGSRDSCRADGGDVSADRDHAGMIQSR
jgi:hypothetical protein